MVIHLHNQMTVSSAGEKLERQLKKECMGADSNGI